MEKYTLTHEKHKNDVDNTVESVDKKGVFHKIAIEVSYLRAKKISPTEVDENGIRVKMVEILQNC